MRSRSVSPSVLLACLFTLCLCASTSSQETPRPNHEEHGEIKVDLTDKEIRAIRKAAAEGDAAACRRLGDMHFNGHGVEQDAEHAARWWDQAAKAGSYKAANRLAQLLYSGDGVPSDKAKAIKLWAMAADAAPPHDKEPLIALLFARIIEGGADAWASRKRLDALAIAGNRRAKDVFKYLLARKSADLLFVDVPFIPQARNYCTTASATALLRHQGVKVSQFQVQRACPDCKPGKGIYWSKLVAAARTFGCEWRIDTYENTDEGFAKAKAFALKELAANRAIIIDWYDTTNCHTTILCGYNAKTQEFFFRDPGIGFPGIHVRAESWLKKNWATRGYIPNNLIVRRPMIRIVK